MSFYKITLFGKVCMLFYNLVQIDEAAHEIFVLIVFSSKGGSCKPVQIPRSLAA